jgi:hypothetical protein
MTIKKILKKNKIYDCQYEIRSSFFLGFWNMEMGSKVMTTKSTTNLFRDL